MAVNLARPGEYKEAFFFARIFELPAAFAVLIMAAIGCAASSLPFERDAYEYVPSAAPAVLTTCFGIALVSLVLAAPRTESLEVTAGRSLRVCRLFLVLLVIASAAVLSLVGTVILADSWYLRPFFRDIVLVGAVSMGIATALPRITVAPVSIFYVAACYFGSSGTARWDMLFAEPSAWNVPLVAGIALTGFGLFIGRGSHPWPHDEET